MSAGGADAVVRRDSCRLDFLFLFDQAKRKRKNYDPVIARFFSPDNFVQMPEFTQAFNRYSYCLNNPLSYTDPSGNLYNPVYDKYGNHLGNTSEGFVGAPLVYSGTDKHDWKSMTAKAAVNVKGVSLLQDAALSAEAFSKIYTHVLQKGGYDTKNLIGEAVAVNNGSDQFNNPNLNTKFASGSTRYPSRVTVNQLSENTAKYLTTVENIQNALGVHEFIGHGKFGYDLETHYKAFELQIKDPTWDKTTDVFKHGMIGRYLQTYRDKVPGGIYSENYRNYYEIWKQLDIKLTR
jgi:hypothetical protein